MRECESIYTDWRVARDLFRDTLLKYEKGLSFSSRLSFRICTRSALLSMPHIESIARCTLYQHIKHEVSLHVQILLY